jgi:hypothetical protein
MKFKYVADPKSAQLLIRLTPDEKRDLAAKAADCCMPVSAFVLKAIQGRQTRTRHDLRLVNELRSVAMELKAIYQAEKPRNAIELEPVMQTIAAAIERIATESRINL